MPDYLEKLEGNDLAAAARQVNDPDAKIVLAWMEKQKAKVAVNGMKQIDSEMGIRYQGAFILLEELIDKLGSAKDRLRQRKDLDAQRRSLLRIAESYPDGQGGKRPLWPRGDP